MAFRLGIDTGGTYIDGVMWDNSERKKVRKGVIPAIIKIQEIEIIM